MGQLVREVLEEKVNECPPKPRSGIFASGYSDTGRLAGEMQYEPDSWR